MSVTIRDVSDTALWAAVYRARALTLGTRALGRKVVFFESEFGGLCNYIEWS